MEDKELTIIEKTVIVERAILLALATRENHKYFIGYVDDRHLLPETQVFLSAYQLYYDLYTEHTHIDYGTFLTQFCNNWHANDMDAQTLRWYTTAIESLQTSDLDDAETALLGLLNQQFLKEINQMGAGSFDGENIRQLLDKFESKRSSIVTDFDKDCCTYKDIDFELIDKTKGIPHCLSPIQNAIGGMVNDSLVLINATYGIGKSAYVITQAVHTFLYLHRMNINRPILFLNTEGQRSGVWAKFFACLYQKGFENGYPDIIKNKDKILHHFTKTFNPDNFLVFKARGKGLGYIRTKIQKYQPALIILDMAMAINAGCGSKGGSDVGNLEYYFDALREMSGDHCPIMATVQAGSGARWYDAENREWKYKEWPGSDEIYGSKSAVQGAAETIITIGKKSETSPVRCIQTTKVKAVDTAKFTCVISEKNCMYKTHN